MILYILSKGCAIKGLVVCWSMARINDLWDRSMDQRKVSSLVPCCGQDGNRAQVPQHLIDSYNNNKLHNSNNSFLYYQFQLLQALQLG